MDSDYINMLNDMLDSLVLSDKYDSFVENTESSLLEGYNYLVENESKQSVEVNEEFLVLIATGLAIIGEEWQSRKEWKRSVTIFEKIILIKGLPTVFTRKSGVNFIINDFLNNIFYNLGVCWEHLGDLDKSIIYLEKAIEAKPSDSDALFNLGMFLARKSRFDEAIVQFERFLKFEPEGDGADEVRNTLIQAKVHQALANDSNKYSFIECMKSSIEYLENDNYQEAQIILKICLNTINNDFAQRVYLHYQIATVIARGWKIPPAEIKGRLTQNEIDEIAANLDYVDHFYKYFLKDTEEREQLKGLFQASKEKLRICLTSLNARLASGKGVWATNELNCILMNGFPGYPKEYYLY